MKATKPWVKVGISPFGIWRPGHPPGIAGFDQYAELYADAKLWLNEGWVRLLHPATLLADRPGEAELPEAARVVGGREHEEAAPVARPLHQPRDRAAKRAGRRRRSSTRSRSPASSRRRRRRSTSA